VKAVVNEIVFVVVPFIVTCLFMYLIGAFVSASWEIIDWTWNCRTVCAIWGITFGFALWLKLELMR
jgi:hypothetical protein